MNFPAYYPAWMWSYFAAFGTVSLALVALIFWNWMKSRRMTKGGLRQALLWNMWGYAAEFTAAWFACGIGAGPGFLLSTDASMHNPTLAAGAAMASMFFGTAGWGLLLVGMRKMLMSAKDGKPY